VNACTLVADDFFDGLMMAIYRSAAKAPPPPMQQQTTVTILTQRVLQYVHIITIAYYHRHRYNLSMPICSINQTVGKF
jgi:hypothetical protein